MTKDQIKDFLTEKPGYLKVGPERLSERLNCSVEACRAAQEEVKLEMRGSVTTNSMDVEMGYG